ncbi:MAG: hypothetical protein ACKVQU_06880 [Burkholderiales bacterium]
MARIGLDDFFYTVEHLLDPVVPLRRYIVLVGSEAITTLGLHVGASPEPSTAFPRWTPLEFTMA